MAIHSTNYYNTFIRIAPDSKAQTAEVPPLKEPRSAARRAYDMLADSPYQHTSDDVLYEVGARPRGISREAFFSKGQACFRASPLTKRYGFGLHYDAAGRMALVPAGTPAYEAFCADSSLRQLTAMKSGRLEPARPQDEPVRYPSLPE